MQIYDFTIPELDKLRELCNFSPQELEYFNLRSKHKSNEAINELLNSPLTLSNARNLSALIVVQSYLQNAIQSEPDSLKQELNDILPRYKEYCEVKQRYQRNQASDDELIIALRRVCKEVKEFLLILYQNTDMQIERTMLKNMVSEVREAI